MIFVHTNRANHANHAMCTIFRFAKIAWIALDVLICWFFIVAITGTEQHSVFT